MPKSKRNKQVELAKTKKHGMEGKKKLYNEIRSSIDTYTHLFIFSVNDMRNSKMNNVRHEWRHSRFFIGKNKVMALALGRSPEEEYRPNLHKIGERLKGEKGLLFSNQSPDDVVQWFNSYMEGDYARSGNRATENVTLREGPLPQFPHSLEAYLRQLGLPTTLQKGVIHLIKEHEVCKEGDVLTPEAARLLKLLGYEMAEFQIKIECVWSQDGSFKDIIRPESNSIDSKENIENNPSVTPTKKMSKKSEKNEEDDGMEVTENEDEIIEVVEKLTNSEKVEELNNKSEEEVICNEELGEDEINHVDNDVANSEEELSLFTIDKVPDKVSLTEITEKKIKECEISPKKFSPKMTRARAAAKKKGIDENVEQNVLTKSARKSTRNKKA